MRSVAAQDQLEVQLEAALYPTSVPVVRATGALEGLLPNTCGEADQHSTRMDCSRPSRCVAQIPPQERVYCAAASN